MKTDKSKAKIGLMVFVVLLAMMSFVSGASAQIIYVPTDYPTIQEAINAASPGDTIFVHIGTYYEGDGVSITKDKITLQGEDVDRTIIHGKDTAEKVVYVTGDYVNVSGFTVTGGAPSGIYVASSNCIASYNIVDSNYRYGIYLDSASDCVLEKNTANSNSLGIYVDSASDCVLEKNTANSNSADGILLISSSNCVLENNIANSNGKDGIRVHYNSNNCVLENNIAKSNGYDGISLHDSSNCVLENNIANLNNRYGIDLYSSSNNVMTRNTADANGYGIHLWLESTSNTITENNVANNNYGMYLDYSGDNEIYHNNFINNNKQAYDHGGFNSWDKGLIIGGNYWSDHVCHGNPSDGSEPYTKIDTDVDAVDNYPFEDPNGWVKVEEVFDTSSGTYPSIMGIHNGTIRPSHKVIASKMYTYACEGTGGHSEWVAFYNSTTGEEIANGTWKGYKGGDHHYITFDKSFTLKANVAYNYTIKTGSYPQIHHTDRLEIDDGVITCTSFVDANGKRYNNWIPAIRLE